MAPLLTKLGKLARGGASAILYAFHGEKKELKKCLDEVGEKRKQALAKRKRDAELVRKHRTIITSWTEDDRYADDRFYQKKLQECHDRYTKSKYAMGVATKK